MTAVLSPADASAKALAYLTVTVECGDLVCNRDVYPVGDTSIGEIVAAMREDCDFCNPLVERGKLTKMVDKKCLVLADYFGLVDGFLDDGELTEVTAHFDDDSSEEITL